MKIIMLGLFLMIVAASSYGMWRVGRKVSYVFAYEDLVIETINERVKSECVLEIKE